MRYSIAILAVFCLQGCASFNRQMNPFSDAYHERMDEIAAERADWNKTLYSRRNMMVGVSEADVLALWGNPEEVSSQGGSYFYSYPHAPDAALIEIKDGALAGWTWLHPLRRICKSSPKFGGGYDTECRDVADN